MHGGGQLFQDEYLDFPLKLWWLARRLREAGASPLSTRSVSALGNLAWATAVRVRLRRSGAVLLGQDPESKRNLVTNLARARPPSIHVDPDPALLARTAYPSLVLDRRKAFDTGLGIMHPRTLLIDASQTTSATQR